MTDFSKAQGIILKTLDESDAIALIAREAEVNDDGHMLTINSATMENILPREAKRSGEWPITLANAEDERKETVLLKRSLGWKLPCPTLLPSDLVTLTLGDFFAVKYQVRSGGAVSFLWKIMDRVSNHQGWQEINDCLGRFFVNGVAHLSDSHLDFDFIDSLIFKSPVQNNETAHLASEIMKDSPPAISQGETTPDEITIFLSKEQPANIFPVSVDIKENALKDSLEHPQAIAPPAISDLSKNEDLKLHNGAVAISEIRSHVSLADSIHKNSSTTEILDEDSLEDLADSQQDAFDTFDHVLAEKGLADLLDDSERGDGRLKRADVDRLYIKRELNPSECAFVEKGLRDAGIIVAEETEKGEEIDRAAQKIFAQTGTIFKWGKEVPYLDAIQEREYGRAIQLYLRTIETVASGANIDEADRRNIERRAEDAKRRLIISNLRWVAHIAAKRRLTGNFDLADLVQEGTIGLITATQKYDPEMGFRFKTYATWWILQAMERALADKARTIRMPVHVREKIRKLRRTRIKLMLETGKQPSYETLGNAVGLSPEAAAKLLWFADRSEATSLEENIGEDFKLEDTIEDEDAIDPIFNVEYVQLRTLITRALATVTAREERIIRMRFGINLPSDATLQEIGDKFGVTRERIRQIEAKALRKLKHPSRSRRLRGAI